MFNMIFRFSHIVFMAFSDLHAHHERSENSSLSWRSSCLKVASRNCADDENMKIDDDDISGIGIRWISVRL